MTLTEAIEIRDAVKAAYMQALMARATASGDKSVTRQEIASLRKEMDSWERVVAGMQREVNGTYAGAAIATWTR